MERRRPQLNAHRARTASSTRSPASRGCSVRPAPLYPVNPGVASHGGFVNLLEVKDNVAYIQLGGGCQGCAQVDATLKQAIEVAIQRQVPEIVAVRDTTDHAAGTNPYFEASKK